MATVIILSCGTTDAQRWRWHSRPYRVVTVVTKPDVIIHVDNSFSQRERFKMAIAYLKNHEYITVKKYAKITELSKAAAEAAGGLATAGALASEGISDDILKGTRLGKRLGI